MHAAGSSSQRPARNGRAAAVVSRAGPPLDVAAVLLPVLALLVASCLLLTDPSDSSYECPGSTWTLLRAPAVGGAPDGFFDAASACNAAALERARAAMTAMLSGLSLVLVVAATSGAVARAERRGCRSSGAGAGRRLTRR